MEKRYIGLMFEALIALASAGASANAAPLPDLTAEAQQTPPEERPFLDDVVVTGRREQSPADTAVSQGHFDRRDLESFGASTLGALLETLSPQTRNVAGNEPIILLNGRRISGFSEVSSLPPEAVKSVDILPESVALSYGYPANARVVNIVLVDRFRATIAEGQMAVPSEGGRATTRLSLNTLRIHHSTRWSLDGLYRRETSLLESERGLAVDPAENPYALGGNIGAGPSSPTGEIDPRLSILAGRPVRLAGVPAEAATRAMTLRDYVDTADRLNAPPPGRYRTLLPGLTALTLNGSVSGFVFGGVSGTLNLRGEFTSTESRLGLPGYSLLLPANSSFSPFALPVRLFRASDIGAIDRDTRSQIVQIGTVLNGRLASWQWSFTANANRDSGITRTDRGLDPAPAQALLQAGDPTFNPFGPLPPSAILAGRSTSRWTNESAGGEGVLYGRLLSLPSGPLATSITAAVQRTGFTSSSSVASAATPPTRLHRDRASLQIAADLPITATADGPPKGIGAASLNGSLAVSRLSDFGTIRRFGYGLDWRFRKWLTVSASVADEDSAPTMQQLGQSEVETPGVRTFDVLRERSIAVTRIEAGNPLVRKSNARTRKLGLLLKPIAHSDMTMRADYSIVRETDPIFNISTQTTELEASYPERFLRDATGILQAIDSSPTNFFRADQETLRWGFTATSTIRRRNIPAGAASEAGRVDVALFHTWTLRNDASVTKGGQHIDFLHGSASSLLGGFPEHQMELQSGFYREGLGVRLSGYYRSRTSFRSTGPAHLTLLNFGGLGTFNLSGFADLGQRPNLVRNWPWMRNLRISLSATNILDSRLEVHDRNGSTPAAFQPAYLDPIGRSFALSVRKLF